MLFLFLALNFVVLKRIVSILLLMTMFLNGAEMHHLIKLPDLVDHYFEHKKESNNLSFVDFIKLHYSDPSSDRDAEHQHLPFKSENCHHSGILMFVHQVDKSSSPETFIFRKFGSYNQDNYTYLGVGSIFQPPQV